MEGSFNPWLKIWTSPRATIARLITESPNRGFWILAIIYGFSSTLNWFQSVLAGERVGLIPIFMIALIISPLWGYLGFSIWSFFVYFTGKWFKGKGSYKEVRLAYAWSFTPMIINVVVWIVLAALFGRALFGSFSPEKQVISNTQVAILFSTLFVRLAAAVWSIVIYLNALAEVRRYSILKAIGNVILSILLVAAFVYVIMWVGHSVIGSYFIPTFIGWTKAGLAGNF